MGDGGGETHGWRVQRVVRGKIQPSHKDSILVWSVGGSLNESVPDENVIISNGAYIKWPCIHDKNGSREYLQ